ncbi:MAG: hypothetical protein AAGF12_40330 [Myxococcota bacterium]
MRFLVCVLVLVGCNGTASEPMTDPADASLEVGLADAVDDGSTLGDAPADVSQFDATEGGDAAPIGSAGCGGEPGLEREIWLPQTLSVAGVARDWFLWLPEDYDPNRSYAVVYQFHGCSDQPERENNNVPVQEESGGDAIHVRGRAVERCWEGAADGPDVAFFDALVTEVEANFCADPTRRFATGYSSGAFLTHRLACVRGDTLRAVATIAGGLGGQDCAGSVAALLIHDRQDPVVNVSASEGARDAHAERNGCEGRVPTDPSPCEAYEECAAELPVVWCQTDGRGHSRQDNFAAPTFWDFLSDF